MCKTANGDSSDHGDESRVGFIKIEQSNIQPLDTTAANAADIS